MKCPICSADIVDLYPKVRCRRCGYIESCCQPEIPCLVIDNDMKATDEDLYALTKEQTSD